MIVSDEDVDRALHYLRDSSPEIGATRERLIKAEAMVKHVEALLFLRSGEKTVDAKKAAARTSQEWLDAVTEEATAAGEFEKMKALREAAVARLDAWRTEQASSRQARL